MIWKDDMEGWYGRMGGWYGRVIWKDGMEGWGDGMEGLKNFIEEWYGRLVWKDGLEGWYGRIVWKDGMEGLKVGMKKYQQRKQKKVSVLLSALIERFFVSCMRVFYITVMYALLWTSKIYTFVCVLVFHCHFITCNVPHPHDFEIKWNEEFWFKRLKLSKLASLASPHPLGLLKQLKMNRMVVR